MTTTILATNVTDAIGIAYTQVQRQFELTPIFKFKEFPSVKVDTLFGSADMVSWVEYDEPNHTNSNSTEKSGLGIYINPESLTLKLTSMGFFESPLSEFLRLVTAYSQALIIYHLMEVHDITNRGISNFEETCILHLDPHHARYVIRNKKELRYCEQLIQFYQKNRPTDKIGKLIAVLHFDNTFQDMKSNGVLSYKSTSKSDVFVRKLTELLKGESSL